MSDRTPCCICDAETRCMHAGPHVFCYRHGEQRLLYETGYYQERPGGAFVLWSRGEAHRRQEAGLDTPP